MFRYGWRTARRLLRFRTSGEWLDHLAADRYLSPSGFQEVYGGELPGCTFTRLGPFMGVVWEKPQA
ncbi:hypothetical protein J2Z79_001496 [Symbiobacterium terraclitae]|uniref:Uncharacterized protein n=1 Tax=Symbiobacterium terraclitae TaxID=557451 RepID=A0ABS4JRD8_9FIRM|nr:hypothetical protein [Symbiobacterium terraclitae]